MLMAAAACAACAPKEPPVSLIFDTDMAPDYDDVGALAVLHALADSGEARILATVSSNRLETTVPCIDVINTYFGREKIPLGAPKGEAVSQDTWHKGLRWTSELAGPVSASHGKRLAGRGCGGGIPPCAGRRARYERGRRDGRILHQSARPAAFGARFSQRAHGPRAGGTESETFGFDGRPFPGRARVQRDDGCSGRGLCHGALAFAGDTERFRYRRKKSSPAAVPLPRDLPTAPWPRRTGCRFRRITRPVATVGTSRPCWWPSGDRSPDSGSSAAR